MGKSKSDYLNKKKNIIIDLYKSGLNCDEISKKLGNVSQSTVSRFLKKCEILRTHEQQLEDLKWDNIGRIWTDKARKNVSIGVKNSYTNELRNKRSADNKRIWSNMTEEEKKKRYLKGLRTMQLNAQKANVTSIELKVKEQLNYFEIRYIHQKPICKGKYILDFYLPGLKLVIECNGDYWHRLPERVERDKKLKKYVESTGRIIIFIWEHEINDDWFCILDYINYKGVE